MDQFEVGDVLVGKVNGCKLEVVEIQDIELMDLRVYKQVKYKNLDNNEIGYAAYSNLIRSAFDVVKGGAQNV